MSYFGDKPSSRVLRPPGGGSSNIFGGPDEAPMIKKSPNSKPTYQSSVFEADPEPSKPRPTSRTENTSSNIFGSDNCDSNAGTTAKKISKTQQSSIFPEPEAAVIDDKDKDPDSHRISNIPMFTDTGPEEHKRPLRRPITAPTQMPQALSDTTSYGKDPRPGVGEVTRTRKAYKPANASLQSTVFDQDAKQRIKQKRCYEGGCLKQNLFSIPEKPRVIAKPLHRNQISSVFSNEEVVEIKSECQKRPMSATYHSDIFGSSQPDRKNSETRSMQPLWSADDRGSQLNSIKPNPSNHEEDFAFSKMNEEVDKASVPIWSADGRNASFTTSKRHTEVSRRMQQSSLFQEESSGGATPLWSSDYKMAPCSAAPKPHSSSATFKSTLFSSEHTNAQFARPILLDNRPSETSDKGNAIRPPATAQSEEIESISSHLHQSVIIDSNTDALNEALTDKSISDSEIGM